MSEDRPRPNELSRLGHEARSALNAIVGGAELLLEGRDAVATERQRELAGRILRSGRRLVALIDRLADVATAEGIRLAADRAARLARFAADGPRLLADARDAALRGDLAAVALAAQALEQPVAHLGAPPARDAVRRLAMLASRGDDDGVREALGDLEREIAEALVADVR